MSNVSTTKKLRRGIFAIVALSLCLVLTTFALFYTSIAVRDNIFSTGKVEIDLNGGKPIISEHEFIFEPGMTVKRNFFVKNKSTCEAYYKLYFEDIYGDLANYLTVTVTDGNKVLYSTNATDFTDENTSSVNDYLKVGEQKNLTAIFYLPPKYGNQAQNLNMSFTMCAKATQVKNNPYKNF